MYLFNIIGYLEYVHVHDVVYDEYGDLMNGHQKIEI